MYQIISSVFATHCLRNSYNLQATRCQKKQTDEILLQDDHSDHLVVPRMSTSFFIVGDFQPLDSAVYIVAFVDACHILVYIDGHSLY